MSLDRTLDQLIGCFAVVCSMLFAAGLSDSVARSIMSSPVPLLPQGIQRDAELAVLAKSSEGKPLAGVTFTLFWRRGDEYFWAGRARSERDGSQHFQNLPRGSVWLLAEGGGYARTSTELVLGSEPRAAEVILKKAHTLRVSVKDEAGQAIAGATVLVRTEDPLPHGALTEAAGEAHFDRLGRAPYRVQVSAQGYETQRAETGVDVSVVLRRLGALSVHVVDAAGRDQARATVVIGGPRLWPSRRTETDARGRCTISGLLGGSYDLRAAHGASVSATLYGFTLEEGKSDEVTLRLGPGRIVRVLVVDGESSGAAPVAQADVVLVEAGIGSFPLTGRSDARGVVELGPIAEGPAVLAAHASGFVGRSSVQVPAEPLHPEVRLALLAGGTLSGEVVDAEGYPIGGASIEVIGSDNFGLPVADSPLLMNFNRAHFAWALPGPAQLIQAGELGVMPGPVPPIPGLGSFGPELLTPSAPEALPGVEPWVTRGNGEFVAFPVTPGRVRALVRHPDFVEGVSELVLLEPGGRKSVRVELFRGGMLHGRVLDNRGFPERLASVQLNAVSGTYESVTFTADDGSFEFAAVPKQVTLSVARAGEPGRAVLREHLEVTEGGRTEIELNLPEPRESVEFSVRGPNGENIGLAELAFASLDPGTPRRETLFTDDTGRVTFSDAVGLPARVSVAAPGYAPEQLDLGETPKELEIVLGEGVLVEGRVTAVGGRFPVSAARVTLLTEGERRQTLTDDVGQYRFEHVPLGKVRLNIEHVEHARATLELRLKDTGRSDRAFEVPSIDLVEPGRISGRVLDSNGQPVRGARVALGQVPAYLPAGSLPEGVVLSDGDGQFLLEGLAPGSVQISAYAAGVGRGSQKGVLVEAGTLTDDIVIKLLEAGDELMPEGRGNVAVTLGERGAGSELELLVVNVAPASEAERAGLLAGDRLSLVSGERPRDLLAARTLLSGPVGSLVLIEVSRGREQKLLSVVREQVRR